MKKPLHSRSQTGFTLAELATVMVILALILGGIMTVLPAKLQQQRIDNTAAALNEAKEALINFALANGRLPCPAAPGTTGVESFSTPGPHPNGAPCSNPLNGFLPGTTLGLTHVDNSGYVPDGWQGRLRYAVSPLTGSPSLNALTQLSTTGQPLNGQSINQLATTLSQTAGVAALPGLIICNSANGIAKTATPPACPANGLLANQAVALVLSTGDHATAAGADETENITTVDRFFVSHEPRDGGAGGDFSHQLAWISGNLLIGRMVAAGRMP